MTTNVYLNDLLFPLCNNFGGCFSCDNIPSTSQTEEVSYIVNLSKAHEDGTHFIAIIVKEHCVYYFDSFGQKCTNSHILSFMSRLARDIVYNSVQVQDFTSKMCGFYCALIVIRNDANCKMKTDLQFHTTTSDLFLNDKLCVDYICKALTKMSWK